MKRLILTLLLVSAFYLHTIPARASLAFSASTDNVTAGSNAVLDDLTTATYLAWVYPTSIADSRVVQKGLFNGTGGRTLSMSVAGFLGTEVDRATTSCIASSSSNALTANTWWFVGGQHNTAGVTGDQKVFVGTLTTTVAEVSSYSAQSVGSGAVNSNAAVNQIIGNKSNNAAPFPGRIAWVGIWNRILTIGEIRAQQFNPQVTSGNVLFMHLGYNDTGTQVDWSGNLNQGTVTGATVASHVPLGSPFAWMPFTKTRSILELAGD